jgi:hypothetical protein
MKNIWLKQYFTVVWPTWKKLNESKKCKVKSDVLFTKGIPENALLRAFQIFRPFGIQILVQSLSVVGTWCFDIEIENQFTGWFSGQRKSPRSAHHQAAPWATSMPKFWPRFRRMVPIMCGFSLTGSALQNALQQWFSAHQFKIISIHRSWGHWQCP